MPRFGDELRRNKEAACARRWKKMEKSKRISDFRPLKRKLKTLIDFKMQTKQRRYATTKAKRRKKNNDV